MSKGGSGFAQKRVTEAPRFLSFLRTETTFEEYKNRRKLDLQGGQVSWGHEIRLSPVVGRWVPCLSLNRIKLYPRGCL